MKFIYKDRGTKPPKVVVKVDSFDVWSVDYTLSLMMVPLIERLIEDKNGAPYTDDEDVPENLRSTAAAPKEKEWDTDEFHFERWNWILREIQWGFTQIASNGDDDYPGYDGPIWTGNLLFKGEIWEKYKADLDVHEERIDGAMKLFGKYFRGMWI